jgi:microcystin-dependent protein
MSYVAYCPTGTIFSFGGTSAPNGWLLCDGSAVSRTIYAQLYAAIGSANGSGDGSTTFNIPDLRGRFLRGVAGTATTDPDKTIRIAMNSGGNTGNAVGSVQGVATSISSGTQSGTKSTLGLANSVSAINASSSASSSSGGAGAHNHIIYRGSDYCSWNGGPGSLGGYEISGGSTPPDNQYYVNTDNPGNHTHSISTSVTTTGTANAQAIAGDTETRPVNAYVNYIIKV